MLIFYRKFLGGAAGVVAPLTDSLKGPGKFLPWSPALVFAFHSAKDLLASVPELVHPRPHVDASDSPVDSVLQQLLQESV